MSLRPLILLALVATAAPAAPAEPTPPPAPFQPQVNDPMLAPPPAAQRLVESWQQALAWARERSTDLRSAQANVQRAEGRWRQSLSAVLPNARMSASVTVDALHPDVPTTPAGTPLQQAGEGIRPTAPLGAGTVSLTQSLVDLGAWRGLASAEAAEDGAQASLRDVQRRLTLGLARALVATVAVERAAELNRVGLRQALERAALTQRSFELGAGTQLDVMRVRQDVEVAREALVSGDEQLRRAREALGLALGFEGPIGVSPSLQLQSLVTDTQNVCAPLDAVGERPDLVAARAQLESARESRRQASAGYLPTLGLASSLNAFTTEPGPARVGTWNISAVLSVPLWEGGLRQGLVDQTRATCTPLKALGERPDLEAARAQVESAHASTRQASAGYLPTLGINSNINAFTTEPGPGRVATWSIAAVLSVPLWEGGGRAGIVRERAGLEQQAAETLERTRRDVEVEVARARRSVEVAESLVKTAAESRELAARTDQLTRRAYEVGRGSSLELVQSGAALRQAELSLALREFELVQARLDAFLTEARCDW